MEGKTLLLVDGSALIHRAYHGMPGLTDKQGRPSGAVYGFARMLLKGVGDLQPEYVVVAMDRREPTFRKELFVGYQANRPEADPELAEQFGRVRELLEALEIPMVDKAGFEADDVIGTLCELTIKESKVDKVIVVTGDKDLMQLVTDRVNLYMPVKGMSETATFDMDGVMSKLGVRSDQVVDYKALVGDPSDNYPGVHGIGPKTAITLLGEFGSFEDVYAAVDAEDPRIKPAVLKKLVEGREGGELSKQLAQIRRDVDVSVNWDQAEAVIRNPGRLARVLEEFGFSSLVGQLKLEEASGAEQIGLF